MTKQEFVASLRARLSALPKDELEERISFYCEMIDDRTEEGVSETDAVSMIGSVDEIAEQIISDIPLSKIVKEKIIKKRRFKAWEIVLLSVGSPIWVSLLAALFAVVLSLYVSLWAVIASVWSAFAAFAASVLGGTAIGVAYVFTGSIPLGIAFFGASVFLAGLAIFAFFGSLWATKGAVVLTRKTVMLTKKCFMKKGEAK